MGAVLGILRASSSCSPRIRGSGVGSGRASIRSCCAFSPYLLPNPGNESCTGATSASVSLRAPPSIVSSDTAPRVASRCAISASVCWVSSSCARSSAARAGACSCSLLATASCAAIAIGVVGADSLALANSAVTSSVGTEPRSSASCWFSFCDSAASNS